MKFENALQPDVKNLKNVFGKDFHGKTLLKVPRLVTSGYLMDDPEWSSNPHVHDFTELRGVRVIPLFSIGIMRLRQAI